MERNHFRPRDFTCCVGISNPFPLCSRSVTRSCYKKFRFNSSPCRCRSQQTPVNRGNKGNTLFKRKLLQQIIPGPEKGRNLPPCNRPQPAQQIYRELPFSNGKHFLSEDTSKKGRLYDMHRPEGCIPLRPRTQVLPKVPVFPMEKQMLCLPRPTIWAKYSSQGVYKTSKTSGSVLAEKRYSNNRLPRRLPNPGLFYRRFKSKHSINTRPPAVARLHHKLGEVPPGPQSVFDISGPLHRFTDNVIQSPREKDSGHTEQMSKSHSQSHYTSSCSGKPHRDIGSSPPCHLAGPPTLQTITNTAHKIPSGFSGQLRDPHVLKQQCSHRTSVVAPQHNNCKRQHHQSSCPRVVHNLRRLQGRLGCMLPESNRKWSLVSSGSQRSYQCSRTQSSFSCHQNVSQTPFQHHCVSPHGQYHSRCPHKQQRGYPFPSASEPNSRTMAVVPSKINSDHRSALTRQTQQCGRQRVKRVLRLQRMANRPTSDPALSKKVQCRSLCVTPNDSALNLRQLETRPRGYLHRCNDPRLVPSQRLRLSTIQSDRTSTEKSVTGQSRFGPSGPSMAGTTLVASPPEPVNQESCHDPKLQTPAEGPCVPSENPSNVPQASFSRLSVIREQHQTEGFSEDITRILQSATRASTHKTYQSAWGVWHSWCAKRQVNSISATLNDVLLFLTDRFNNGAAYRSVNVARSAISSCHAKIDGYPVGQHPLVIQLLKGMLNMRPPKPRYTHTWDVHLVTKYLSSLGKTKLLPLKLLSIKLAMLFALSCPERASSLAKLDLRHCRVAPEGVFFTLVSPRKRGSPDQLPQAFFASFPHNERLCPVGTLRHYLKATRNLRPVFPASKPDPLFVSYIKPHNPITTPTLSRWLRMVLKNAGINTDIFKAHSVRGASTTAAVNSNVPLDDVMKMADWSRVSTFQKFYYKPIFKANYAHSVLQ